jgi:hypothetical protein
VFWHFFLGGGDYFVSVGKIGYLLFFLCFVSVQNFETMNPPARGKNKQALGNKIASSFCVDMKHNKILYLSFTSKEILHKV